MKPPKPQLPSRLGEASKNAELAIGLALDASAAANYAAVMIDSLIICLVRTAVIPPEMAELVFNTAVDAVGSQDPTSPAQKHIFEGIRSHLDHLKHLLVENRAWPEPGSATTQH